jgi:hypothetical protein
MSQQQRMERYRELRKMTKTALCRMARELGAMGGVHPLERWTKDEVVYTIIDLEGNR